MIVDFKGRKFLKNNNKVIKTSLPTTDQLPI